MIKGIFILMLLVLFHEFGHFVAAKWAGIYVQEFSIGFGPIVFKYQGKETAFSIRLFPLGGYCSMEGENGESNKGFYKVSTLKRILVLAAGPITNLLVGFFLVLFIMATSTVSACGLNVNTNGLIGPTDRIVKVDDFHIFTMSDIFYAEAFNPEGPYQVVIERNGEKITLSNYYPAGDSLLNEGCLKVVEDSVWSKLEFSVRNCASMIQNVYLSVKHLVLGDFGFQDVNGPIGIANSFKDTTFQGAFTLMAFISINLGVLNLLPIPALDGGQIVIALLERIFCRRFNEKVVAGVNFVFLIILFTVISVVSINDIVKLLF